MDTGKQLRGGDDLLPKQELDREGPSCMHGGKIQVHISSGGSVAESGTRESLLEVGCFTFHRLLCFRFQGFGLSVFFRQL